MLFKRLWTVAAIVILAAAFGMAGCSDSSSPTDGGGNTDTTPPGVAGVTAVDENHIDVEFSENVVKGTAERSENYVIIEATPVASMLGTSPGDTVHVGTASLDADGRTVHLTTWDGMQNAPYDMRISGVKDASGNAVESETTHSFTGTSAADVTAPTIVSRSPSPGQTNVGTGQSVVVQFSEPMDYTSVVNAFSWTHGGGVVTYGVEEHGNAEFVFTPLQALLNNTMYTVSIAGSAQDWAGNNLASASWDYTTTAQADNTPPTLVSSTPSNGATNVSVGTNLVLTFSEPVETSSLNDVLISPEPGDGVPVWSNGNRTVTFDPDVDLMDNTQYTLLIIPGGVRDLAGNGNVGAIQIVWSTGSTLESGGIAGTISGPGSADAPNPAGATVIAADRNPFGEDDDFGVGGSTLAPSSGVYTVSNLPDAYWWPLAALDSNGDGNIEFDQGDAFGVYGVELETMSGEPDSVMVSGSVVTGVNFAMYDPVAISGVITYTGSMYQDCCYPVYVGAFDTTGFDIDNGPDFGTEINWPSEPMYAMSTLDNGLAEGTYYVGAYLDADFDGELDPGEPMMLYGGMNPTPLTLADGGDALNVDITLTDVPTFTASNWSGVPDRSRGNDRLRRVADRIQKALDR